MYVYCTACVRAVYVQDAYFGGPSALNVVYQSSTLGSCVHDGKLF